MTNSSDIVTTRTLSYTTNEGDSQDFVLTIFRPTSGEFLWECRSTFSAPFDWKHPATSAGDYLAALLSGTAFALQWLQAYDLGRRATWRGRPDCGLPTFIDTPTTWTPRDIPPPGAWNERLTILGTRGFGDGFGEGSVPTLILTIYEPLQGESGRWECGLTFSPPGTDPRALPVYYGVGADYIEALLDAASIARAILERDEPSGSPVRNDLMASHEFPYKIGDSFLIDFSRVKRRSSQTSADIDAG